MSKAAIVPEAKQAAASGARVGSEPRAATLSPKPAGGDGLEPQSALLSQLLRIESDARRAASVAELSQLMANECRGLVRARQVFVIERPHRRYRCIVRAVSSIAVVDRQSPLVRWIETLVRGLARADGIGKSQEFVLPAYCDQADATTATYPFTNLLWVPLWSSDGRVKDGILLARETPWLDSDRRIAARLAETCGHALALLRSRRRLTLPTFARTCFALLSIPAIVALGFYPVPITALAPLELVPRDPHIVAMPVDGIVQSVLVAPNETVKAGRPLVRLNDTVVRNKHELANREVAVAEARVERSNSLAFTDAKSRHELGIARAELALRIAERSYARELLEQLSIAAAVDGVAVFSDRKDLEGKPLATGDRIMQIARAGAVELKIDLPVATRLR